ncbi:MAG TPA: DUF2784 domain-containing protein [Sphingobacteriaceae bacterium]
MLALLDILLTILHLVIIGFNLFGWIWPGTRKLHFVSIVTTAAFWFLFGIWYGVGYCPITDWQWRVKERMGEENLPDSFIKYFADDITGNNISASLIDILTTVFFALAVLASVVVNFIKNGSYSRK